MNMEQDISLKDLLVNFWHAKFYMALCVLLTVITALVFVTFSTPTYQARMIVAPADGYALGDYASSIEYDEIASLPFWRPTDQDGASIDFHRFIYTLRGPSVAEILIKDETALNGINKRLNDEIKTSEELAKYLSEQIRIDPLGATQLRRIIYNHPNSEFASALLRKIHLVADQMIRRDRRRQSQSRIEYLDNALKRTMNPDHRKGITNLLMQQEHIQMLANLDEAYAAIVVEPPSSSPKPTWPNKPLSYFVSVFVGLLLGYIIWSLRHPQKTSS